MTLTKELLFPHVVWPQFCASTASQDKAKINSPHTLTLPWFTIYTYYTVKHFKIALGLVGKLLSTRKSGISRGRHHLQQWLLNLFLTSTHSTK